MINIIRYFLIFVLSLVFLSCDRGPVGQEASKLDAPSTSTKPPRTDPPPPKPDIPPTGIKPPKPKSDKPSATAGDFSNRIKTLAQKTDERMEQELEKLKGISPSKNVIGLRNCGNTCYMNSILQALFHTDELNRLLKLPFDKINLALGIDRKKSLFKLLYALAQEYRSKPVGDNIDPNAFVMAQLDFLPLFRAGEQQDAQEYLQAFFMSLSEELNLAEKMPKDLRDYQASDEERANFSFIYNDRRAGRTEYSIINFLFEGYFKNTTEKQDGSRSIKYEPFQVLPLPFPTDESPTLQEMMALYQRRELLIDSSGNVAVTLSLYKAPRNLIIQLKRFDFIKRKRIDTPVTYPRLLKLTTPVDGDISYDLYAISMHSGTMTGGHYTAMIKSADGKWHHANDSVIKPSDEATALNKKKDAYILFYRRR